MKILQLCKKFLYPLKDGESLAVFYLSKSLTDQNCSMDLLSMNTQKHYFNPEHKDGKLPHYTRTELVDVDTGITVTGAFNNLFTSTPYHISRFESSLFRDELIDLLEQNNYDIVLLESLFMMPYIETIRQHSKAKVILRAHNVENEIWYRIAAHTKNPFKKWFLSYQAKKLEKYERQQIHLIDGLIPISEIDAAKFTSYGYRGNSFVFPMVINAEDYPFSSAVSSHPTPSISFIGSMDWIPNREGIEWFVMKVFPWIIREIPQVTLHIAGRNMPQKMHEWESDRIHIHGEIEDAKQFLRDHPVNIVPLFSGSGMRVKIIEAMALGPAIVTTSIGVEGIPIKSGEHLFIEDRADLFAQKVNTLLTNLPLRSKISVAARAFVEQKFDYRTSGQALLKWLEIRL